MAKGKSFRIDKEKKYVHAVAFKTDDEGLSKLDSCFELLKVKGKRRSDKMRNFVNQVHVLIDEHEKLSKKGVETSRLLNQQERLRKDYDGAREQNAELKKKVAKLTKDNEALMKAFSKIKAPSPTIAKPSKPEARPLPKQPQSSDIARSKDSEEPKEPVGYSMFASLKDKPSDYFTCQKDNKAYKFLELPCVVNPLLSCPKKTCNEQVLKLMK